MANVKISGLPAGAAIAGTEVAPFVQSAATVKTTANQIGDFILGGTYKGSFSFNSTTNILTLGTLATPPTIKAPNGATSNGASFAIVAGDGNGTGTFGGDVNITAGAQGDSAGGGGNINLTCGTSNAAVDTLITLTSSSGTVVIGANDLQFDGSLAGVDLSVFVNQAATAKGSTATVNMSTNSGQFTLSQFPTAGSNSLAGSPVGSSSPASVITSGSPNLVFMNSSSSSAMAFFDAGKNWCYANAATNNVADTNGFWYAPFVVGNQTGVPANTSGAYANSVPIRFQNNGGVYSLKAYINGGWRSVNLT
jgi:hypothetical protein